MENRGLCLESWIKAWAVQALQRYGFPFFEHMEFLVGMIEGFIGRGVYFRCFLGGGGRCWKGVGVVE